MIFRLEIPLQVQMILKLTLIPKSYTYHNYNYGKIFPSLEVNYVLLTTVEPRYNEVGYNKILL